MFRKFLKKKIKTPEVVEEIDEIDETDEIESVETIDIGLLEEHLDSIRVTLLEIRSYRKKKVVRSPTLHFMQTIDIEEAWSSCRDAFHQTYALLSQVADHFEAEHEALPDSAAFGSAIDQFVNLIDRITLVLDEQESFSFTPTEFETIDNGILKIQHSVNLLKRQVMFDFTYNRNPKT